MSLSGLSAGNIAGQRVVDNSGLADMTFNPYDSNSRCPSSINSFVRQSDGKILIGGQFTSYNGVTVNRIARLNADGTLDLAFAKNIGAGANNTVNKIVLQSTGHIVAIGAFTAFDIVGATRIIRLNPDGTVDTAFAAKIGTAGATAALNDLDITATDKIVVGGAMTTWNGNPVGYFVQLDADGLFDSSFTANAGVGANNVVNAVHCQPSGQILIGGSFTSTSGVASTRLARYNVNGTVDSAFSAVVTAANGGIPGGPATTIKTQPDGKILLSSSNLMNYQGYNLRLLRLQTDLNLDVPFADNLTPGPASAVSQMIVKPNGKIAIAGNFTLVKSTSVNRICQINQDGTLDTTFIGNVGSGLSANSLGLGLGAGNSIFNSSNSNTFNGVQTNRVTYLNDDGTFDTSIAPLQIATNGTVSAVAYDSSGRLVIGGTFTTVNGVATGRIARFNTDGSLDTAFISNTGAGANAEVTTIAAQPDGKLIVSGTLTNWNGVSVGYVVRLNTDGTQDTAFTTAIGTGASGRIDAIAIQPDSKILLGGSFATFGGTTVNGIVRLESNGTREAAFTTNVGTATGGTTAVNGITLQSDGKIIVVGAFTTWNTLSANRIVRLNSDGTTDSAFRANVGGTGVGANSVINQAAVSPDGKINVAGAFTTWSGVATGYCVRLNSDGTRDSSFAVGAGGSGGSLLAVVRQGDGKIVVAGSTLSWNSVAVGRILRLNADGSRDTTFTDNSNGGASGSINDMAISPDGNLIIGGSFASYGNKQRTGLARILLR